MTERSKLIWVYLFSTLFIVFNSYLIINNHMWGALVPLAIFIVLLYFISLDKIVLLITFLTPLAINFQDMELGFGISIPTEPLMIGVLIFFIVKLLYEGKYDNKILRHPLTVAILFYLIWMFFTSITSEIPMVSFKSLLSKLWFIVPFYFFAILMFKKYTNVKLFVWLYAIPFLGVIFYTLINHSIRGFDEESGHWVMTPFYNDHTAYGAILALFLPLLFMFSINKKYNFSTRVVSFVFFFIFALAIVLSYSRAAWISLAISLVVFIIVLFKIKFRWVVMSLVVLFSLFFTFQQQILDRLEQNQQDSSANLTEHVRSIYNISSNASNLERINRWQSAIRMFHERPFWGWGPGTYQFLYAPFQMSQEKTIISTNAGDLGNAHSEYIGPLAESGILGMLSVMIVFSLAVYYGLKVYRKASDIEVKMISLAIVLGLISYFIHGFLNNFLDSDKASVPVWGFMAIIIALDLYHSNKLEKNA
ncbi:MAG: O-antigen ligase family protein [Bacteroidales bacterium]|nr:O-antigen ligase family protein [Bacteroidales bacterium]